MTGFEPANAGTTNQCRNRLATPTIDFIIHEVAILLQVFS
jgi:hypothetical protein